MSKRVLGHAANASDVTAVHYNWHNYDAEALQAVEAWAKHVAGLVCGEGLSSNVVKLKPSTELLVA